ncbi:hypothetical protein CFSAN000657_14300 [Salmonella enterica subsp. enterica serovar Wein str. CFSAN000657]|nr:hypothetical protein [Salmonella enterica subsp. enterica serovar Wien str. CFSAN000657]
MGVRQTIVVESVKMILDEYCAVEIDEIAKLSFIQKMVLGVCFLQRQAPGVKKFDVLYQTDLSSFFLACIGKYKKVIEAENDVLINEKFISEIEKNIPDTESYGELEGSLAQNAMIALYYMALFITEMDDGNLYFSLDKLLDSVDIKNQDATIVEDDILIFNNERIILSELLLDIKSIDCSNNEQIGVIFKKLDKYLLI